jgi:hypothetical protein
LLLVAIIVMSVRDIWQQRGVMKKYYRKQPFFGAGSVTVIRSYLRRRLPARDVRPPVGADMKLPSVPKKSRSTTVGSVKPILARLFWKRSRRQRHLPKKSRQPVPKKTMPVFERPF